MKEVWKILHPIFHSFTSEIVKLSYLLSMEPLQEKPFDVLFILTLQQQAILFVFISDKFCKVTLAKVVY